MFNYIIEKQYYNVFFICNCDISFIANSDGINLFDFVYKIGMELRNLLKDFLRK